MISLNSSLLNNSKEVAPKAVEDLAAAADLPEDERAQGERVQAERVPGDPRKLENPS